MPRVLDRASRLLAALAERRGADAGVRELAVAAALPPATCTRLLKALVRLGWADQDGNRHAYRLGPRAFALAAAAPYREAALAAAMPVMRALASRFAVAVTLVGLRPWRRIRLWECTGHESATTAVMDEQDDVWATMSGRLLVAALPARTRARWIERLGVPDPGQWRGIADRRELLAALDDLRRTGHGTLRLPGPGLTAVAALVRDPAGGHVALGAWGRSADWAVAIEPAVIAEARRLGGELRKRAARAS